MPADLPVMIITGASSGIGAATARLMGLQGYRLLLAARRIERLQALADEIQEQGGIARPVAADLSQIADTQYLVQTALADFGRLDILFNNAGIGRMDWLEKLDPEQDIAAQVQVNLLGSIYLARAVLPHMIAQRRGHIIQMGSVASFIATPTYSVYAASKFAVRGFAQSLRREVGIYGIQVSVIYPGGVETEFAEQAHIRRRTRQTTPSWLRLSAAQVAQAVYKLVQHPRRSLIIPWPMQVAVWANRLLPGWADALIERYFVRPERQ